MLTLGRAKTFGDYSVNVFMPYIRSQIMRCRRLNVIRARYIEDSMKSGIRTKHRIGIRTRVLFTTRIPQKSKRKDFLRVDENKQQLFDSLSEILLKKIVQSEDRDLFATKKERVLCPSKHEEISSSMSSATKCDKDVDKDIVVRTRTICNDRTSCDGNIHETRKSQGKSVEQIPPAKAEGFSISDALQKDKQGYRRQINRRIYLKLKFIVFRPTHCHSLEAATGLALFWNWLTALDIHLFWYTKIEEISGHGKNPWEIIIVKLQRNLLESCITRHCDSRTLNSFR
ncbi:hypothetical protein QYM36_008955 [Artemia franciscana]|uniref:Uncharacterized protein n=1 Tax=Artemia franciscana TaxID=6661 RepID=A0AA88I1X8_ARTSF|nr:hypothetical protein QYM36_008955 [Artemia franciscana]